MDTSSKTQMAEILGKHSRSCGTSWTTFIGHQLTRLLWKRPFEEVLLELGWEKVPNWACLRSSKTRIILIGKRGGHKNGWKEAEYGSHAEEIDEKCGSWWTHIISWSRKFGMYWTWMQTKWNYCWGICRDVWITYFCWSNLKNYCVGKSLT